FFFFQAEDGIRDGHVTGVQTCALPISIAPATPFGATWIWAAMMAPGRLLAMILNWTVPSRTWKTASPRAAFVAEAHPGTSSSALNTATKVRVGCWAAPAATPTPIDSGITGAK